MLTEYQEAERQLRSAEIGFQQMAEAIGAVFWLAEAANNRIVYVSPSYERIWGRSTTGLLAAGHEWFDAIHEADRARVMNAVAARNVQGEYEQEYRVVRQDGDIRWIHDRAFPVRNEAGAVHRFAGIAEDITERRRLEQEVIEMSDRDLSRLGQDLHDGICQQLVSIAFASDLLRRDLMAKLPSEAIRVARITALLDNAISQARNLSHTLCPVNLVGHGLGNALRELANSTSRSFRVVCEVDCDEGIRLADQAAATHLYRIALEAVQSAIKYGRSTRILISLHRDGDTVSLSVTDNGSPMDDAARHNFGVELNIMKYRAGMAGGTLELQSNPFGGNVVTCHCGRKLG